MTAAFAYGFVMDSFPRLSELHSGSKERAWES